MPAELPYLASYKNVTILFERIAEAKIPDVFTHKYLQDTIGLKSNADRTLISLLRTLDFIDASNKPTPNYSQLKNSSLAKKAIGRGTKLAYKPLFDAKEDAYRLSGDELKGLISQVTGADVNMTTKIAGTFLALTKIADFSEEVNNSKKRESKMDEEDESGEKENFKKGNPEFHYNIQVHLPSGASEETYLNIFNAIRKVFK